MTDALADLSAQDVSIWLDDISRERLESGNLQDLADHKHVVGVTSNPTIFQKALEKGTAYDEQVRDLKARQVAIDGAIRYLMAYDIRWACDVLRPRYDGSGAPSGKLSVGSEIESWCGREAADERKPGETDEQFIYKTRKKAYGPFKRRMWEMDDTAKQRIVSEIEAKFAFLMEKLGVFGSRNVVNKHVPVSQSDLPAYAAASEELSAMATVDPNEGE